MRTRRSSAHARVRRARGANKRRAWQVRQRYAIAPAAHTDVHGEPARPRPRHPSTYAAKSGSGRASEPRGQGRAGENRAATRRCLRRSRPPREGRARSRAGPRPRLAPTRPPTTPPRRPAPRTASTRARKEGRLLALFKRVVYALLLYPEVCRLHLYLVASFVRRKKTIVAIDSSANSNSAELHSITFYLWAVAAYALPGGVCADLSVGAV